MIGKQRGDLSSNATPAVSLSELLARNAQLRDVFAAEPVQAARLSELQRWQAQRLRRTYADLGRQPRYREATRFFLEELYAAGDARARDRDVQRAQRALQRLLPPEALRALSRAVELEILTQELDAATVRALGEGKLTEPGYAAAYRRAGPRADRERQIALTGEVGRFLQTVAARPWLHGIVRLARGPAHAAGVGALQEFLERGLNAFESMQGADEFLATIASRETRALQRLFAGEADPFEFAAREGGQGSDERQER